MNYQFEPCTHPSDPTSHVHAEPVGGGGRTQLVLIKLARPCNEVLQGLRGQRQSGWADPIAQPVEPVRPEYA